MVQNAHGVYCVNEPRHTWRWSEGECPETYRIPVAFLSWPDHSPIPGPPDKTVANEQRRMRDLPLGLDQRGPTPTPKFSDEQKSGARNRAPTVSSWVVFLAPCSVKRYGTCANDPDGSRTQLERPSRDGTH